MRDMVYTREQSRTVALLGTLMCSDVAILIEGYLIPDLDPSPLSHSATMRQKLRCGFAEYIEMEIGTQSTIESMFIDSCKDGGLGDVYAFLSAGARNLKAGLAVAVMYNRLHVARLLVALDAIESSAIVSDLLADIWDPMRDEFIIYVANHPETHHLLSMFGTFHYPNETLLGLRHCVKSGSIIGVEILLSKAPIQKRDLLINEIIIHAVNYSMVHIAEYALDNGADIQVGIKHANRIRNNAMLQFLMNKVEPANPAKRRRCC